MARIVVYVHAFDRFARFRFGWPPLRSGYMIHDILRDLGRLGHSWQVVHGPEKVSGDVALLHVDASIVPDEYLRLADRFPATINFGVADITKRAISDAVIRSPLEWDGPVLVKSNLNSGGTSETKYNNRAARKGESIPFPGARPLNTYRIFPSADAVEAAVWNDPDLAVERFVPEVDDDGYALRIWVFCGERERCTRYVAKDPIVKGSNVLKSEPCEVPDHLRRRREELRFDYGKFDFVIHKGEPVLFDANRTPGHVPALRRILREGTRNLALGFDEMIRQRLGR